MTSWTCPEPAVKLPYDQQGIDPLLPGLSDPDEDARGEGYLELAGQLHHLDAYGGPFAWSELVAPPPFREPGAHVLQHQPHGGVDVLKPFQLPAAHCAGVAVGQQGGLLEDELRGVAKVIEGSSVAVPPEPLFGLGIALLRPFPESEEGLGAAQPLSGPGHRQDLVGAHVKPLCLQRGLAEGAVAAKVTA